MSKRGRLHGLAHATGPQPPPTPVRDWERRPDERPAGLCPIGYCTAIEECPHRAMTDERPAGLLDGIAAAVEGIERSADIYPEGRGCPACDGTGFVSDEDIERLRDMGFGVPHSEVRRALGVESKEEGAAEHEHYWVDAADDETGWHCTVCGVTEYPELPPYAEDEYNGRIPWR